MLGKGDPLTRIKRRSCVHNDVASENRYSVLPIFFVNLKRERHSDNNLKIVNRVIRYDQKWSSFVLFVTDSMLFRDVYPVHIAALRVCEFWLSRR